MAILARDQQQIGWFVKSVITTLHAYLAEEVKAQPEYHKLCDHTAQVYKEVEEFVQDKLGFQSWRARCTSYCNYIMIPGCSIEIASPVPIPAYFAHCPLSEDETNKLISMYGAVTRLDNIRKVVLENHYRNYTDLALEIPFIETLSDAGKIPINTKEYKTVKEFKPEPLMSKEDNMFLQSIVFRAQLAGKELPRIKSFKPFQFR